MIIERFYDASIEPAASPVEIATVRLVADPAPAEQFAAALAATYDVKLS